MNRNRAWMLALAAGMSAILCTTAMGASPTPSYLRIQESIEGIRSAWDEPQGDDVRRAEGWNAFVSVVEESLAGYAAAPDKASRRQALNRLSRLADALRVSAWPPAVPLQQSLDAWLAPRLSLSEASRRLEMAIQSLPPAPNPEVQDNRQRWIRLDGRLSDALRDYESAVNVGDRVDALDRLRKELDRLRTARQTAAWAPAAGLHGALAQLFELPNVQTTVDATTVAPFLSQQVVFPDVIYRMGQYSYVTPGPRTGFGLLHNDYGISFMNSQIAYSFTPVRGFTEQMKQEDPRGRRVAQIYHFEANTYNTSQAQVVATISTNGISLNPTSINNVDAAITSFKQPGAGPHVTRSIASLVGFNQNRITQEVYSQALPQIRQQTEIGAREEAAEKSAAAQAELNAVASQYLIGNNTIAYGPVALTGAVLQSRPSFVFVQGTLQYLGAPGQLGADFPQPPEFQVPAPGVTADVHLPSALTNMLRGFYDEPVALAVQNLAIAITPEGEEFSPEEDVQTQPNVTYETFLQLVSKAQATNNPAAQAIRVFRPSRAPEISVDREGNLAVVIHDFKLEVGAPSAAQRGGLAGPPARVYRIESPRVTVALNVNIETAGAGQPLRVNGQIASLDTGPNAAVYALNDDENQAQRLNAIVASVVLGVLRNRTAGQEINQTIDPPDLQGFSVHSVSDLHPTGWIRAVLMRTQ